MLCQVCIVCVCVESVASGCCVKYVLCVHVASGCCVKYVLCVYVWSLLLVDVG